MEKTNKNDNGKIDDEEMKGGICMLMAVLVVCIFAPLSGWLAGTGHIGVSHMVTFAYAFASGALWMYGASSKWHYKTK